MQTPPPSSLYLSVPGTVRSMGNTVVGNDPVPLSGKTCPPQPSSSIQQLARTGTGTGPSPVLRSWKECSLPQAATCALLSADVLTRTLEQLRPPKSEWEPTEGDVKQGEANMVDLLLGKTPIGKREMFYGWESRFRSVRRLTSELKRNTGEAGPPPPPSPQDLSHPVSQPAT